MIDNITDEKVVAKINEIRQLYINIDDSWKEFYVRIFQFKELKTSIGFNDILLNDGSVVKKSKLVKDMFNITASLYSRISNLVDRFFILEADNTFVCIRADVRDFDRSKLMELYTLSEEELALALQSGAINPYMPIKEIRKYIKSLKEEDKITKPSLEELECNVKPSKKVKVEHYLFSDLKKYKKVELIDMYLDLQRAYENLKELSKRK